MTVVETILVRTGKQNAGLLKVGKVISESYRLIQEINDKKENTCKHFKTLPFYL